MKILSSLFALLLLGAMSPLAHAGPPSDAVKATTDRILSILSDSKLQGDSKKQERLRLIRSELDRRFDWAETARGCLGHYWSKRTAAEQKEFVNLFSQFLQVTYIDKYDSSYSELDSIEYKGEKLIDNYASVKTLLHTKSKLEHPVEYRLEKAEGGSDWKIYDTVIEGISLVKNYRDQFDAIIAKSSYEGLIKELKAKVASGS